MVKSRLAFIACFFVFGFAVVALKATEVMLFGGDWHKADTANNFAKHERMEIVDRNGVLVATNLHTSSIYAKPQEMMEKSDAAKKLSQKLRDVNEASLLKDFNSKKSFTWIKRNITPREQKAVNELGIPGVYFTADIARIYPQGKLLPHVLGYVNIDNQGLAGIEREFDDLLSFKSGDMQLAIDIKLQQILREELLKQVVDYRALGGVGMVIDVTNGEVLALISLPDFDPNSPGTASADAKFNRATLGIYEMGSTFKAFTAAIALDTGAATPNTVYDASRPIQIGHDVIHDYHSKKRALTLTEVLMYSSNVGTARLALSIGHEALREHLKKFGMYDMMPIEIPEKGRPLVPKRWSDVVTMTVGFGHGIAVTPVHMVQGYQAIVNGGFVHPLTLLKKKEGEAVLSTQILKQKTSDQMRVILRDIVLSGTGRNADVPGYQVGGKTGTAEKQVGGKYVGNKVMSSFVGIFPMNKPKYLVFALIDEPQEKDPGVRPTAAIVAAPVIKNFIGRAGPLLGIKPRYEPETSKGEVI